MSNDPHAKMLPPDFRTTDLYGLLSETAQASRASGELSAEDMATEYDGKLTPHEREAAGLRAAIADLTAIAYYGLAALPEAQRLEIVGKYRRKAPSVVASKTALERIESASDYVLRVLGRVRER